MPLTSNSFSAVGLFFGFLVNATLTKLWKVGLLKKIYIYIHIHIHTLHTQREEMLVPYMYMWKTTFTLQPSSYTDLKIAAFKLIKILNNLI
jgi:hypothetical protein